MERKPYVGLIVMYHQHAGDYRHIHLYFDAVFVMADQVTATKDVLEKTEINFYSPAMLINCSYRLRLKIEMRNQVSSKRTVDATGQQFRLSIG